MKDSSKTGLRVRLATLVLAYSCLSPPVITNRSCPSASSYPLYLLNKLTFDLHLTLVLAFWCLSPGSRRTFTYGLTSASLPPGGSSPVALTTLTTSAESAALCFSENCSVLLFFGVALALGIWTPSSRDPNHSGTWKIGTESSRSPIPLELGGSCSLHRPIPV